MLFDLDGTLVDSMHVHFRAWKLVLKKHEIDLKENTYFAMEGMSMRLIAFNLLKKKYRSSEIKESLINSVVQKKKEILAKHQSEVQLYPGVLEILSFLISKKIKIGLVTASHSDQLKNLIDTSLLNHFNCVISGDKVKEGKPNPESYLKGISGLGLLAHECIAIENAPLGIRSAKSAELYCIGICSTLGAIHLSGADEIINNFSELKKTNPFKYING